MKLNEAVAARILEYCNNRNITVNKTLHDVRRDTVHRQQHFLGQKSKSETANHRVSLRRIVNFSFGVFRQPLVFKSRRLVAFY